MGQNHAEPVVEGRSLYIGASSEHDRPRECVTTCIPHDHNQLGVVIHDNAAEQLANVLLRLLAPYGTYSASDLQAQRVMTYSPRYRLAFSLLNEDAISENAALGWDVPGAIQSEKQATRVLSVHPQLTAHQIKLPHYWKNCPSCTTSLLRARYNTMHLWPLNPRNIRMTVAKYTV